MVWWDSSVRRLSMRVPHLAVGLSASTLSLFPSNSIHFGWILVLIRCSLFRFRFLDEFMYVYVCVHSFASCNRFLLSLFYFLSFRCMFSPLFVVLFCVVFFSSFICRLFTLSSIYQGDSLPDESTTGAGPDDGTAAPEMSGALAPSVTTSTINNTDNSDRGADNHNDDNDNSSRL